MSRHGFLIPRFQLKDTENRLKAIFENNKVDTVVFNGDIKHEFGLISRTEWLSIFKLLDFVGIYCKNVVLIKGNHDILLEPIAKRFNIKVQDYYKVSEYFISHGDKIIDNLDFQQSKTTIIGNEHAAISLRKSGRRETYKCFLLGRFKDKKLIVMPSFNTMVEGTDILKNELISPMLKQDLNDFNVYVVADKVYNFGKVKDVEKL